MRNTFTHNHCSGFKIHEDVRYRSVCANLVPTPQPLI